MKMRPLFSTVLDPLAPMNDMNCSTRGSRRITSATARWCSIIDSNEMSCEASVKAKMVPLSSLGMKPLGIRPKR
jgi:hypothetical protein